MQPLRKPLHPILWRTCGLVAALLIACGGCGKSANSSSVPVLKPAEAAAELQKAFGSAPEHVKNKAAVASEALRAADYDRAVQSLVTLNARKDLTPQQYVAVHESEVAMVGRLIAAMQAGDLNAKRAYEAYKRSKN